jgi:hypothetical protein
MVQMIDPHLARLLEKATTVVANATETNQVWRPWAADPARFAEHLRSLPGANDPAAEVELVDADGHYEPGNVQLVTRLKALEHKLRTEKEVRRQHSIKLRRYVSEHGGELKAVRGGVPQTEIAKMAEVPQSYISRMERGDSTRISYDALVRILSIYMELDDGQAQSGGNAGVRQACSVQDVA